MHWRKHKSSNHLKTSGQGVLLGFSFLSHRRTHTDKANQIPQFVFMFGTHQYFAISTMEKNYGNYDDHGPNEQSDNKISCLMSSRL